MKGIRGLKRDVALCEWALRGLYDAEPHLTETGVYEYDKVPQNLRAACETLIRNYKETCNEIMEVYHEIMKRKARAKA